MIPRSRGGMLWRFLLAAVVIIGATAATTAVAGLLQFKQLAHYLDATAAISNADVTLPPPGSPQTILVVGSDHRAGESFRDANTDTMMLVRLDPSSSTVNVLSIPRDLEVQIPGYGTNKVNAAYSLGGTNLMIKTIQQNVFPQLHVNHILDINFKGFSDLVDAIGCVYAQVDHRYYNQTAPGPDNYSSIDIQPGYEELCGHNQSERGALAFVRFRHTDTDIVRNARQQSFIRWAKEQYSIGQLLSNRDKLLSIFGHNVQTDHDLRTVDGLINLFNLVVNADGLTIKSIPFPAQLQTCTGAATGQAAAPCYVTADPGAEAHVFRELMSPTKAPAAAAATHPHVSVHVHHAAATPGLTADVSDGAVQSTKVVSVGFPVFFPKLILDGSFYCSGVSGNCNNGDEPAAAYASSYPRAYAIRDRQGINHAAYYMTIAINPVLGEYYGVQGTTWQHPPLLDNPSATKVVDGKQLELFAAGGKLTTVAWRTPRGVYWISNTLTNQISNSQMVAIAASLTHGAG